MPGHEGRCGSDRFRMHRDSASICFLIEVARTAGAAAPKGGWMRFGEALDEADIPCETGLEEQIRHLMRR